MKHKKRNSEQRHISNKTFVVVFIVLIGILILSAMIAITFANADISISDVYKVVVRELFHIPGLEEYSSGPIHDVVWLIRAPRVVLSMAVGIGLSVCGVVMQAVVKNPLADPYILGISSGASMGATLAILFGIGTVFGAQFVGVMAFLGAVGTSFAVLFISKIGGTSSSGKLILSGMAVSAVCSAFSSLAIYIAHNKNATADITFWTMGSMASAKWNNVVFVLPIMIVGLIIFWTQSRSLNLMLLGDEASITLGTNLQKVRGKYMILSALMVGFAVYSSGTIGFVGLIVPHAVRMFCGTDHRKLLPLSALVGGIFLIWADVLCRSILKNSELPIGILISVIGAPCFIYLMASRSYGFGGRE